MPQQPRPQPRSARGPSKPQPLVREAERRAPQACPDLHRQPTLVGKLSDRADRIKPVVAVVAAVTCAFIISACSGGPSDKPAATVTVTDTPSAPTETAPATFTGHGYIDVASSKFGGRAGDPCINDPGYEDVTDGAQVTVSSPSGRILAVGRLGGGRLARARYLKPCRFHFTVTGIPEGLPLYKVEVSHRGALTYSEADLRKGLTLTLGS
jgi:hypothetical protein